MAGISTESMMATITDLVAMSPRATGTTGGAAAAQYVHDRFRAAGLDKVWFEETQSFRWAAEKQSLRVGLDEFPVAPILHSALPHHDASGELGTGDDGVRARVVDIGTDKPSKHDVSGAIVLFDLRFTMTAWSLLPFTLYLHDPDRELLRRDVLGARNPYVTTLTKVMREAAKGGAVAVIGVLRDYPEDIGYHNEYYRRSLLSLPGLWISERNSLKLRTALRSDPRATLTLVANRERVMARSVVGVLVGASNETIMVQSHHDSVGSGAVEDASGTAEVIAIAEHEAERSRIVGRREKTLMFVTFDTHFTGYEAHQKFARDYALNSSSPYRIALNLTVEHIGLRAVKASDGSLRTLNQSEPRAFFETVSPRLKLKLAQTIRRRRLGATTMLHASLFEFSRMGIPTDASFMLVAGVPIISLISGPLYLYANTDGLEQIDEEQLEPVARTFCDLIEAADASPAERLGLLPRRLRELLPRGNW